GQDRDPRKGPFRLHRELPAGAGHALRDPHGGAGRGHRRGHRHRHEARCRAPDGPADPGRHGWSGHLRVHRGRDVRGVWRPDVFLPAAAAPHGAGRPLRPQVRQGLLRVLKTISAPPAVFLYRGWGTGKFLLLGGSTCLSTTSRARQRKLSARQRATSPPRLRARSTRLSPTCRTRLTRSRTRLLRPSTTPPTSKEFSLV